MSTLGQTARSGARSLLDQASRLGPIHRRRQIRWARHLATAKEPELRLLDVLVAGRAFVDVGANRGAYSYYAMGAGAGPILAVEPVPELAALLRRGFSGANRVVEAAISTVPGTATLSIPTDEGRQRMTRASLEPITDGEVVEITVPTVRLDAIVTEPGAVVKVDVEGHELQALESAEGLLSDRSVSAWLIESEERHHPGAPAALIDLMVEAGYLGWALAGHRLVPHEAFDPEVHQSAEDTRIVETGGPRPVGYANNLCFVRAEEGPEVLRRMAAKGFTVDG